MMGYQLSLDKALQYQHGMTLCMDSGALDL